MLCKFADNQEHCFPSYTTIAKIASISRRSAQNAINELTNVGYIGKEIRIREGGKDRLSNLYTIKRQYHYLPAPMAGDATPLGQEAPQGVAGDAMRYGAICQVSKSNEKDPPNKNNAHRNAQHDYSAAFEEFWQIYPRKAGKQAAARKYRAVRKEYSVEELISAARNYTATVTDKEQQYIKYASTFLGPDRWFEEYLEGVPEVGGETERLRREAERTAAKYGGTA